MKTTKHSFEASIRRFSILDAIVLSASIKKNGMEYHYTQCYDDNTPIGLVVEQFYKQADEVFEKIC
jgi:hypothetical protein